MDEDKPVQIPARKMAIDPSEASLSDVDQTSGMPYLHESFVLHTFVPIRYVRRQKPFDDPVFTGMYPEGFRIPTLLTKDSKGNVVKKSTIDEEITCVLVGKETVGPDDDKSKGRDCVTNVLSTRPGYMNLCPRGPTRQAKSAPAISREKTKLMLKTEIQTRGTSSSAYLKKRNQIQQESEVEEESEPLTPRTFSATEKSKRKSKLPDNFEYAFGLRHPEWPDCATEWASRARSAAWPGKRIEKKIVSSGCHVTPGAHPNSNDPEIEWMYVFFEAERIINKEAISSVQRQCFIVMCLLLVDCLDKRLLSFQQLKSVFYFTCESLEPQYWRSNKALCVNKLLDELLECIRCGNLPDYFVTKNNTLSHYEKADLVQLESDVSMVRKEPAETLLKLTDTCALVNIFPFYCNVRGMFSMFLADAEDFAKKKELERTVRALLSFSDDMCNSFYLDSGFQAYEQTYEEVAHYVSSLIAHGVSGFEEAIEYFVKPLQGDKEAQKHLQFMPQLLSQKNITLSQKLPPTEIWRPIRMCRLLIQKFADGKEGSHLYDHLGCMYLSASTVFKDQRKEVLQRGEEAFKMATQKLDCGIGTYVDYGRFLCKTKRYEECIPIARKVVLKEAKKPESMNFYGSMEACVADEFIKREIEANEGLEVLSAGYAHYLLCECYIGLKKKTDLIKSMSQFGIFCEGCKDPQSYALLGYIYMKVLQFEKAQKQFSLLKVIQPDNKLVEENIRVCEKHKSQGKSGEEIDLDGKFKKMKLWDK